MAEGAKQAHSRIWLIAGPAMIANISAPLVGLVDTWAIGHMPDAMHLAAVGLGSVIFNYIAWAFGFLRMGTTGMVAQSHGAGDTDAVVAHLIRASISGIAFAICLLLFQAYLIELALSVMSPPDMVGKLSRSYFDIRIWAAPATLFIYALNGALIGLARARDALILQLILNISNGIFNITLVIGLGMGVDGVALGTVFAEWLAAIIGLVMIGRRLGWGRIMVGLSASATWQMHQFKRLLNVNGFIFVRTLLLMTALAMIMQKAGDLGDDAMAASHIMQQFMMLISLGLDGFAYAAEALTGAAWGRNDRTDFRRWVWLTTIWALAASIAYVMLFWLAGGWITAMLTNIEDVRRTVAIIMPMIIALPLVAVWSYQFDGIYIGATATGAMMGTMTISFLVYILILDPMVENWGLLGLWGAVLVFMATRGLTQAVWYLRLERNISRE